MAQITHGLRAILNHPFVYNLFQRVMGAKDGRTLLATKFIRAQSGMDVLDIGCGPAEILDYLPAVNYWGFDISESYIQQATAHYGVKGTFTCKILTEDDLKDLPRFDLVLAIGLLHHLDDDTATRLLQIAHKALKQSGRLITVDPCFEAGQNSFARYLISKDRGQNVRTRESYAKLVSTVFSEYRLDVLHTSWIPYTRCYTQCTRSDSESF
jgi:SAM-dependent methyltransferase